MNFLLIRSVDFVATVCIAFVALTKNHDNPGQNEIFLALLLEPLIEYFLPKYTYPSHTPAVTVQPTQ